MKRFNIGSKYEYCPNGNYWQEVSGIFDKEIYLFCDCNKCKGQVYKLKSFNVTKKIPKEQIEKFRKWNKLDEVKSDITIENVDEVAKLLEEKKL
jgi:hypothetical protein